ncbi:DUF4843 domain-containing protein [Sphingobacterium lumbrici]|uniref:DUF4843 domain-containing protein n=1 Tax=Sphingobacterium lumbrici TaxID=2559600 RepID=UPI0015E29D24|nr:DUF4843 domain-containing protein [Sphingobacterium lumbrici]
MKKILLLIACITLLVGCKEDLLDTYSGTPSIYFPEAEANNQKQFSFGYLSSYVQDSVFKFPVIATGKSVNYDRPYHLRVAESSMVEGVDYNFLNKDFVIAANTLTDTVSIQVLRSENMRVAELRLALMLEPNDFFGTEVNYRDVEIGMQPVRRYYTQMFLFVDDIIGAPWFWDKLKNTNNAIIFGYLGDYSAKKLQLMIGRYNLDADVITAENFMPPTLNILAWGFGMQAYLNEMSINGTPILEANGQPMKMGPNAQ